MTTQTPPSPFLLKTLEILHGLSVQIGARGSCTPQVRKAGEYLAVEMRRMGAQNVSLEPVQGAPSTYRPFALAFGTALLGSLLAWIGGERWALALGALLNGLGAWTMLAETDFTDHWGRRLLPQKPTQNAVGEFPPTGEIRQRVVLCAHIDTHRTPVFYSSPAWLQIFSLLVGGTFATMLAGALIFPVAALLDWQFLRWTGVLLGAIQVFAVVMMLRADRTPYTPGANDNASGAAVTMGLAERLKNEPLAHTAIHLAFTDCEETGAHGAVAYLDGHTTEFGSETVYIMLDQVGLGAIKYLSADGLIRKHRTHPRALELARQAAAHLPDVPAYEMIGPAYTDALPATKRGLIALTLCCVPLTNPDFGTGWHQMSDTMERVDPQALENVGRFAWEVVRMIDHNT